MWLSKQAAELVQRATCHFKPSTYFLRTAAPLPSILVLLPNKSHRLAPLLNRLANKQHFSLAEQLATVKSEPTQEQQNEEGEGGFTSIYGIPFNQATSFISCNPQGKLQLTKTPLNKQAIIAVILYSTVEDQKVRSLSSRNYENLVIVLKLTGLVSVYCVFRELKYSTRIQNHPQRT